MHVPYRRLTVLSLTLLVSTGCASSSAADDGPAAQPTAPAQDGPDSPDSVAQSDPAAAQDEWLAQARQDVARIKAGGQADAPAAQPAPPPQDADAQPAPQPAPRVQPMRQDEIALVLEQSREHARLADERVATLVAAFVQSGLKALEEGDVARAHQEFAHAYELDPDDPAARELSMSTAAQLGLPGGELAAVAASARDRAAARGDQAALLARQNVDAGQRAMAAGEPDAAVRAFEDALLLLRANPDVADASLSEAAVAARLAVARRAAADAVRQREAQLLDRALAQQEQFDRAEATRRERHVQQLMEGANAAFLADDYQAAELALDEVVRMEPGHLEADALKRIVQQARHEAQDRATRLTYREEWQDTFDELEQDAIIPDGVVTFPDAEAWAEISAKGNKSFGSGADPALSALDEAVRERLRKAIPVSFVDEPLDGIVAHLQAVTGANFIISQAAREADVPPITLEDRASVPVERILKIVFEDLSLPPLTYTVHDGVVHVLTKEESRSDYVLEMYDIRDLTFTPKDYPAQDFNLLPSGIDKESYQAEDDEEPLPFIGADALLTLIQDNISPDSWSSDPNRTIQLMPGTLVVRQTPDVHAQIHGLLDDLRLNTKSLVHIETRFIEVEDSFLEDIGVDLRGLDGSLTGGFPLEDFGQSGAGGFGTPTNPTGIGTGNDPGFYYGGDNGDLKGRIENLYDFSLGEPGTFNGAGGLSLQALFLDDSNVQAVLRAVTKYQTSNVVNAPSLTLRSGQRGNVKQLTTRTYVRDFEPEIAQAAVIAQPELDNVKEGVILDVRAVASADRRFVTLELRPTIIDLVPDESGNPLPQETVSLATQNSSDVTIELPELRIQRLRTTATIPDGATLMLGGLKKAIEEEQTSTVPFLGDIPVLGSLFSRQGEYTSKRKLIILLKASILNPEENEPGLGARR
jgi:general secretion pathway protein D